MGCSPSPGRKYRYCPTSCPYEGVEVRLGMAPERGADVPTHSHFSPQLESQHMCPLGPAAPGPDSGLP